MLEYLKNFKGKIKCNDKVYNNINELKTDLFGFNGELTIILNPSSSKMEPVQESKESNVKQVDNEPLVKIRVRPYLLKAPTPQFDFHTKYNGGIAMPLVEMIGRKIKETKGMYYMELQADTSKRQITTCMKCGKELNNPISQLFGVGPECGGHKYTSPFESEEELNNALDKFRAKLSKIKWNGWIPKSAILQWDVIEEVKE